MTSTGLSSNNLPEDSGVTSSAFLSAGDNFTRQAKAFRQKLTRPFATALDLKIYGVEVTDLEPAVVPNLYYGTPVRIYGRYQGGGKADVTLRGSMKGVETKQAAQLRVSQDRFRQSRARPHVGVASH